MDHRRRWLALVVVFALWPVVQIVLVHTLDVSPWKLMGWGMYSTIPPRHLVRMREVVDGHEVRLGGVPIRMADEYRHYAKRRASLGRLADPSELARRYLEARPEASAVIIEVDVQRLDPTSARFLRFRRDTYRIERSALVR